MYCSIRNLAMKSFILSVFALVLLLLCGCQCCKDNGSFVLASFNIRCPVDKTPNSWSERKDRCLSVIEKNKIDIFGVQEAVRGQLDDLLGKQFGFIGGGRDDFKNKGEFSAILYKKSRFEVIESGTFGLSEKPDVPGFKSWQTAYPRIATWGIFKDKKSGKTFAYYNTHLDHISEKARVNGIKLIVAHARKNAAGKPLVLSGDFNAAVGSETYHIAKSLLADSADISAKSSIGPRYTYNGYGRAKNKRIIDFIFVSEGCQVLSHKIDGTKLPEGYPSDHFPVITRIVLK